jgi:hypothetical protein
VIQAGHPVDIIIRWVYAGGGVDSRLHRWTRGLGGTGAYSVTNEFWRAVYTHLDRVRLGQSQGSPVRQLLYGRYLLHHAVLKIATRIGEAGSGPLLLGDITAGTPLPANGWLLAKALRHTTYWLQSGGSGGQDEVESASEREDLDLDAVQLALEVMGCSDSGGLEDEDMVAELESEEALLMGLWR